MKQSLFKPEPLRQLQPAAVMPTLLGAVALLVSIVALIVALLR